MLTILHISTMSTEDEQVLNTQIPDTKPAEVELTLPQQSEQGMLHRFARSKKSGETSYVPWPGFINDHHIPTPHLSSVPTSSSSASSEEPKKCRPKERPEKDGQTDDVDFEPNSSLCDADEWLHGFIKNISRTFNPETAVLVVRHRAVDHNVIVNQTTHVQLGMQGQGRLDEIDLYQTIRYKIDEDRTAKRIQIIAGVEEGKVLAVRQKYTPDGEGYNEVVVESNRKKKSLR